MSYKISFKESVFKDLKQLDKSIARNILDKIEEDLPEKALSCLMLAGNYKGLRKYRVGDYRILFSITANDILILRIGHRKKVYR